MLQKDMSIEDEWNFNERHRLLQEDQQPDSGLSSRSVCVDTGEEGA